MLHFKVDIKPPHEEAFVTMPRPPSAPLPCPPQRGLSRSSRAPRCSLDLEVQIANGCEPQRASHWRLRLRPRVEAWYSDGLHERLAESRRDHGGAARRDLGGLRKRVRRTHGSRVCCLSRMPQPSVELRELHRARSFLSILPRTHARRSNDLRLSCGRPARGRAAPATVDVAFGAQTEFYLTWPRPPAPSAC